MHGNINTRIKKLNSGEFDAIVLAAAGLHRLNLQHIIRHYFPAEQMIPAAGQGALGIECKTDDKRILQFIEPLNHADTHRAIRAERAMVTKLEWGCEVPIAAFATIDNSTIKLSGRVGSTDGSTLITSHIKGAAKQGIELGIQLANDLINKGAKQLLQHNHPNH